MAGKLSYTSENDPKEKIRKFLEKELVHSFKSDGASPVRRYTGIHEGPYTVAHFISDVRSVLRCTEDALGHSEAEYLLPSETEYLLPKEHHRAMQMMLQLNNSVCDIMHKNPAQQLFSNDRVLAKLPSTLRDAFDVMEYISSLEPLELEHEDKQGKRELTADAKELLQYKTRVETLLKRLETSLGTDRQQR